MDLCDLSFDSTLMVPETTTTTYSHHVPMSHVQRSTNQVLPSHCNTANGTSIALQPNTAAMFQPSIQSNTIAVPQPETTSMFQLSNPAVPHSVSTSGIAKRPADEMGQPLSPKYKKLCVSCSALDVMSGYGRVTMDKLYFDPSRLKLPAPFSIESFFYFMRHKCEGLVNFDVSYCPGCKGLISIYSHFHSTQFLASALKAYLLSHSK